MALVPPNWHIHRDADGLAQALAEAIVRIAAESIARRGAFHLVLAGGHTPADTYARLPKLGRRWQNWHLYYGDERYLPLGHPERNDSMVESLWTARVPLPVRQHHRLQVAENLEEAAVAYARDLPPQPFDLVLLGLGEDGHCASLFPGCDWGMEADAPAVLPVRAAAKPPPQRISLSGWRLRRSRHVFFLVTGAGKADAVARWRAGETLPAAVIGAGAEVWLDPEAASWPVAESVTG